MAARLKVSEELYEQRLDRMRRLIEMQAPQAVIAVEAKLLRSCFHFPWRERLHDFCLRYAIFDWVLWLISPRHREAQRTIDGWNRDEPF